MQEKNNFWEDSFEPGYYDIILNSGLDKKRGLQSNYHHLTLKEVSTRIISSQHNLDYACGPGTLLGKYFKSKAIGYDVSKKQIEFALRKYKSSVNNFTYDIEVVSKNSPYESITLIGLIEFLTPKESVELINHFYELLEPKGKLIITTPNYKLSMNTMLKILYILGHKNYSLITKSKFTKKTLENLFKETKFNKFKVDKILTLGIFVSIFSHKLGEAFEKILRKIFNSNLGLLLIAELEK